MFCSIIREVLAGLYHLQLSEPFRSTIHRRWLHQARWFDRSGNTLSSSRLAGSSRSNMDSEWNEIVTSNDTRWTLVCQLFSSLSWPWKDDSEQRTTLVSRRAGFRCPSLSDASLRQGILWTTAKETLCSRVNVCVVKICFPKINEKNGLKETKTLRLDLLEPWYFYWARRLLFGKIVFFTQSDAMNSRTPSVAWAHAFGKLPEQSDRRHQVKRDCEFIRHSPGRPKNPWTTPATLTSLVFTPAFSNIFWYSRRDALRMVDDDLLLSIPTFPSRRGSKSATMNKHGGTPSSDVLNRPQALGSFIAASFWKALSINLTRVTVRSIDNVLHSRTNRSVPSRAHTSGVGILGTRVFDEADRDPRR